MKRMPNPWISIPSMALGLLAGTLGWVVTSVSCQQPNATGQVSTCNGWAVAVAATSFLVVTIGVALVLVLVYRSIAEWRDSSQLRIPKRD